MGMGIRIGARSLRLFSSIERSISEFCGNHLSCDRNLKSNTSKPPPEAPMRYSRPFSGGRPVSAIIQVARINSWVQRESPNAGGPSSARGQWAKPLCKLATCFSTISCSEECPLGSAMCPPGEALNIGEGFGFQRLHEHSAAHFAAQGPHLAQAH